VTAIKSQGNRAGLRPAGEGLWQGGGAGRRQLYYVKNPLNDLFALTISVDIGTRHDNRLGAATQFLDKSGTKRFGGGELKKEWYKLGTDFAIGAGGERNRHQHLRPRRKISRPSWTFVDGIVAGADGRCRHTGGVEEDHSRPARGREEKIFRTIAGALSQFNRYGANSPYLRALPNEAVAKLAPTNCTA